MTASIIAMNTSETPDHEDSLTCTHAGENVRQIGPPHSYSARHESGPRADY